MIQYISLPSDSVVVPEKIFLARAGINPNRDIDTSLKNQIEEAKKICRELSKLQALYDTFDFEILDERRFKISDNLFESRMIVRNFENCSKVTLIVATLGEKISEKIDSLFSQNQYSLAFLIDAFASEYVEYFVNKIDDFLRKDMMRKGFIGSKRLSPGYEDLGLEMNEFIVKRLNAENRIGVKVIEDSYMLFPRKSITALIGWRR
ncbi:MAG: hypothetical protein PWQ48_1746 [Thermotogaceae bacterium]|nr:hypothetical protein [Thermotogaceae bacterium]